MKNTSLDGVARIQVIISNYGKDQSGNPTAHYTVLSYRDNKEFAAPMAELAESKRRVFIGYNGKHTEIIDTALSKAGVPQHVLEKIEEWGSRSEGVFNVMFQVKKDLV